jgi:hypothetical protein
VVMLGYTCDEGRTRGVCLPGLAHGFETKVSVREEKHGVKRYPSPLGIGSPRSRAGRRAGGSLIQGKPSLVQRPSFPFSSAATARPVQATTTTTIIKLHSSIVRYRQRLTRAPPFRHVSTIPRVVRFRSHLLRLMVLPGVASSLPSALL